MKKTEVKKIVTVFMMVAMLAVSAFAKGQKGPNEDGKKHDFRGAGMYQLSADLVGQVVSVDEKNLMLTVKDADGKDVKVRVSPFAHVVKMPDCKNFKKPEAKDGQKEMPKVEGEQGKRPEMPHFTIADIKAGEWVAIEKFRTETQTVEARKVIVRQ